MRSIEAIGRLQYQTLFQKTWLHFVPHTSFIQFTVLTRERDCNVLGFATDNRIGISYFIFIWCQTF